MQRDKFTNDRVIQYLAGIPRWAVSNEDKVPISLSHAKRGEYKFASSNVPEDMVTLYDAVRIASASNNYAFNLNAHADGVLIIDIEKHCPDDLKEQFLRLPYEYAERSRSGTGVHLIMRLPKNFHNFPQSNKPALKDPRKYYEILINQWCTLTGEPLDPNSLSFQKPNEQRVNELNWESVFAEIASSHSQFDNRGIDVDEELVDIEKIQGYDTIIDMVKQALCDDEYYIEAIELGDQSAGEFRICQALKKHVQSISTFVNPGLTSQEIISIMYEIIQDESVLPHRIKHDEYRYGHPWLLYTIHRVMNDQ